MRLGAATLTLDKLCPTVADLTANIFNVKCLILSFIFVYFPCNCISHKKVSFHLLTQFILLLLGVSAVHRSLLDGATGIKKYVQRAMMFVKYK
jgi:hypothetical protein